MEDPLSDNPQHRIHKRNCKVSNPFECTKCGKAAISKEALECHMRAIHRPDLELKKCTECEDLFKTKNTLQKHFDKYHGTNGDITRGLPEITKRRKQYFDDMEIEDGEIVNTEELLKSKDDNDP